MEVRSPPITAARGHEGGEIIYCSEIFNSKRPHLLDRLGSDFRFLSILASAIAQWRICHLLRSNSASRTLAMISGAIAAVLLGLLGAGVNFRRHDEFFRRGRRGLTALRGAQDVSIASGNGCPACAALGSRQCESGASSHTATREEALETSGCGHYASRDDRNRRRSPCL
jgi:hypothetical protein